MPRYYFEVTNGHRFVDPAGIDFVDNADAKKYGQEVAIQIATNVPSSSGRQVAVVDDEGREVAIIPIGESAA